MTIYLISYVSTDPDYNRWMDPVVSDEFGYFTEKSAAEAEAASHNEYMVETYNRSQREGLKRNAEREAKIAAGQAANKILKEAGLPGTAPERFAMFNPETYDQWFVRTVPSYYSVMTLEKAE